MAEEHLPDKKSKSAASEDSSVSALKGLGSTARRSLMRAARGFDTK